MPLKLRIVRTAGSPEVSVVMPCHNAERTLRQAIESVVGQSFANWELIVIDDGSTDGSSAMLREFSSLDDRIRVYRNEQASGAARARNRGLAEARGRYIAFLDSDDAWLPCKLELQLKTAHDHNAALVCGAYDVMDGEGNLMGKVQPTAGRLSYRSMLAYNSVGCLTALVDRSLCGDVRFNPALPKSEDYQVWLSILRRGLTAICLSETLGMYRVHGNTLSSNKFSAARHRWRVYREFEKQGLLASVFYFTLYSFSGLWKMLAMRRRRFLP
jgi:glycosyltransferase involved in cell wall biosynthesis